jgi:hypothetical protein
MSIEHLIVRSRATEEFKADVIRFLEGLPAERLTAVRHSPRIKVLRVVAQLLSAEADLRVERVRIDAWSGCSDFRGTIVVQTSDEERAFNFRWDCSWRAEQEGWYDAFQLPDQIRAAHEFGWRCFERWEEEQPAARGAQLQA